MSGLFSAVTRTSRFRHGEGGAGKGDALISMADIVPGALSIELGSGPVLRKLNAHGEETRTHHAYL